MTPVRSGAISYWGEPQGSPQLLRWQSRNFLGSRPRPTFPISQQDDLRKILLDHLAKRFVGCNARQLQILSQSHEQGIVNASLILGRNLESKLKNTSRRFDLNWTTQQAIEKDSGFSQRG